MSNTTEYYANKANLTPVINKIEGKLNNRYTKDEVDDLIEDVGSVETATYEENVALKPHSVGDLIYLSGVIYKVTSAIAIGDTIAVGTNITANTGLEAGTQMYIDGKPGDGGSSVGERITVTGNPLSFITDSTQVSNKTIVSLEPIQAGSGDPSPSNVRSIYGYDYINVATLKENLYDGKSVAIYGKALLEDGSLLDSKVWNITDYIAVNPETITLSYEYNSAGGAPAICWYNSNKEYIGGEKYNDRYNLTINLPNNAAYVRFSVHILNYWCQLEYGSTVTQPITDLTISAPDGTIYGGTLDVESGELVVDRKMVNASDLSWSKYAYNTYNSFVASISDIKDGGLITSSHYKGTNTKSGIDNNNYTICSSWSPFVVNPSVLIRNDDYSTAESFIASLNNVKICYELATPKTYHLSPHQVKLLTGHNTVTTNGTSLQLTYRKGDIAGLDDLSGLAESVDVIGDIVGDVIKREFDVISRINKYTNADANSMYSVCKYIKDNIYKNGYANCIGVHMSSVAYWIVMYGMRNNQITAYMFANGGGNYMSIYGCFDCSTDKLTKYSASNPSWSAPTEA